MEYIVTWTVELDADDAVNAAALAHGMLVDPDNTAVVFQVRKSDSENWKTIDLEEHKKEN